ncbi:MAG: DUF1343 domain-containing protein [Marinilabiliaceae bacterium]|nr:DUF1343 domain-containing protein [Marinilabiliaceae bacterium]
MFGTLCCAADGIAERVDEKIIYRDVEPADVRISDYLPRLMGKRVALVVNHTSTVDGVHLLDTLIASGVDIRKVFVPEHGFRGDADAGANIADSKDTKTGVPIVSLYGKHKKPSQDDLKDVDVVVYDLQDVGARFYTYISTLHYVMEAIAERVATMKDGAEFPMLLVLDRPNPHGGVVDGPVREDDCISFVGVDPLPVLYGLTCGELACMINGEGWLANHLKCPLRVIRMKEYSHDWMVSFPYKPSPNLRTQHAVELYPSLCLFEGTNVSVGRGTDKPFEMVGKPGMKDFDYTFTPRATKGASDPMHKGLECNGIDLSDSTLQGFSLRYLLQFYKATGDSSFWGNERFFDLLAGTKKLREQMKAGLTEDSIRRTWSEDLEHYKMRRVRYMLYDRKEYKPYVGSIDWKTAMHTRWVDSVLSTMNMRQRIGQMIWVTLEAGPTEKNVADISKAVEEWGAGGVLVLKSNPTRCLEVVERLERVAKVPLLFAADAENGLGMKFSGVVKNPKYSEYGAKGDTAAVRIMAEQCARQMRACGLSINFAPVVDINTNPKNPVIGKRSFGDTPELVERMSEAFIKGLQSYGIAAVSKHFPGHGDTSSDSHLTSPVVSHSVERIENVEMRPFKNAISKGCVGVMSAHIIVPALDPSRRTASMSKVMITDILRGRIGFEGLIVTDAVNMLGAKKAAGSMNVELAAVMAGNDVVEFSTDIASAVMAIEKAVAEGVVSPQQIEDSVRRILAVKEWTRAGDKELRYGYPEVVE